MSRLEPDYDRDPGRWRNLDRRWLLAGDVHETVAERIVRGGLRSVLDTGCGQGRLRDVLPVPVGGRASTGPRRNDPELCEGYPATTFDAEEAPAIVADAFGDCTLEVDRWDARLARLPDRTAIAAYARSHHLPAHTADRVSALATPTKRGVLISATVPRVPDVDSSPWPTTTSAHRCRETGGGLSPG